MSNDGKKSDTSTSFFYTVVGASLANLSFKVTQLIETKTCFQKLDEFIKDVMPNRSNVSFLRDRFKDIVGLADEKNCLKTANIIKCTKCLSPEEVKTIIKEVEQVKTLIAERIIAMGTITSAAMILMQLWRLKQVWDAVKDAKNVMEESKRKFCQINQKMGYLTTVCAELNVQMIKYENELTLEQEKKKLMKAIRLKVGRANSSFVEIRCMICEVKVLVDGKKQALAVYKNEQISNGLAHTVQFGANLIQCIQFGSIVGTGFMVLQSIITATFIGLTAANGYMYQITTKTLAQIKQVLAEIDELDSKLAAILNIIHECEDWVAVNDE